MSLDLSRTEERARLLAVINNVLRNLKLFVIIQSSDYEEDSDVLDFIKKQRNLVGASKESLVRFYHKRTPCSCLDKMYAELRSGPKT